MADNPLKTMMSLDAAHGDTNGVRSLASQALKAGANKKEIAETIRVACLVGGGGSVYIASEGLKELFPE